MLFTELGLSEEILRAIAAQGYTTPTPIQAQAIPAVLEGKDLLAGAQTGTGKTAGFTLPILHKLSNRASKGPSEGRPPVRALILTPTRELAAQVEESVKTYGQFLKLTSLAMFGGVSINPQIKALKSRVDILVATPGRLLDHVNQKTVDLSQVEILVLDEADRMLDMGFIRDIRKILALLPKKRQNLLFSATFSDEIKGLAQSFLTNPDTIEVARRNTAAESVSQQVYLVPKEFKRALLIDLIRKHNWFQVLVFTRTKHGANALAEKLVKADIPALAIHGNKSQGARTRALAEFKTGKLQVLVATDIAARGLDIDQLPHVVNFELPTVSEDYVHRIGRTGRAGATGEATSLVSPDEVKALHDIERMIKREIPAIKADVSELPVEVRSASDRPAPSHNPRRAGGSQGDRNKPRSGGGRPSDSRNGDSRHGDRRPAAAAADGKPAQERRAPQGQGNRKPEGQQAQARPQHAPRTPGNKPKQTPALLGGSGNGRSW
ncbi:DEAD/DEAH box helicase [Leeia oryzae]|uniref:DEAD/DEAH box helicase n=1 Tax=Leeia oryzae TaxID=356662 RepID=UPI00035FEB0B|nr:DEAD/DEAH box helicase [Leeia oryzae]